MQAVLRQYKQELSRCRQKFQSIDLQRERGYLMKFTTFSANMENILPTIPREQHERLFQELLLQQIYTSFDQEFLSAGELVKLKGCHNEVMQPGKPHIYCTYHLGSYRLLTSLLYRRGVDCVLLVGSEMNNQQGDGMLKHIEELRRQHRLTNSFRVVEAQSHSAVLTILREIKAGKSVIVYVDGSPETTPTREEADKFLAVKLGDKKILTRKGVAFLSHAAKVPIVPVVSYRQDDLANVLHCMNPIRPTEAGSDRETYCQQAMQQLYDLFWTYLNRYPAQWEGWNYIHSFIQPESLGGGRPAYQPRRLTFNSERYSLCELEDGPILFDRRMYETYEISSDLRDLLMDLDEVDSIEETVGTELYEELLEKEIIC